MGKQKFWVNKISGKCKCGITVKSYKGMFTTEKGKQVLYCEKCLLKEWNVKFFK